MSDSIRAFFEAAEFQDVDAMLSRFTPENAKRVGRTVAERTKAIVAERDRLREALEKIAAMPLSASWIHHFYDAVKMAQDVLQEAGDESDV